MSKEIEAYQEGYKAFKDQELPTSCPYLNPFGDNSTAIIDWMNGWSDAFNDYFGAF